MGIENFKGRSVSFRLAERSDAEYILALRLNPDLNRHISPTDPSVEKQRRWLAAYKKREAAGEEYCHIIVNNDNDTSCGVVRMYDFEGKTFEWGSFILGENKTPTAAVETALFIYNIAFDLLKFDISLFTVHKENTRTISFHKKLGARIVGERKTQISAEHLFVFDKNNWLLVRQKFKKFMPPPA